MRTLEYECEACGVESHITVIRDAASGEEDMVQIFKALEADHKKWSPECKNQVENFKLFKPNQRRTI